MRFDDLDDGYNLHVEPRYRGIKYKNMEVRATSSNSGLNIEPKSPDNVGVVPDAYAFEMVNLGGTAPPFGVDGFHIVPLHSNNLILAISAEQNGNPKGAVRIKLGEAGEWMYIDLIGGGFQEINSGSVSDFSEQSTFRIRVYDERCCCDVLPEECGFNFQSCWISERLTCAYNRTVAIDDIVAYGPAIEP